MLYERSHRGAVRRVSLTSYTQATPFFTSPYTGRASRLRRRAAYAVRTGTSTRNCNTLSIVLRSCMSATSIFCDSRQTILMAEGCNQHSLSSSKAAHLNHGSRSSRRRGGYSLYRSALSHAVTRGARRIILSPAAIDLHLLRGMEIK